MSQSRPGEQKGDKASSSKRTVPTIVTVEETLTAAAEIVRMHNEAANKGASMPEAILNADETTPTMSVQEKEIHSDEAYAIFNLFPITYKLFDQWSENSASTCQQLQRIAATKNMEETLTLCSSFTAQNIERLYRHSLELISLNPKNSPDSALKTLHPQI